MYFAPMLCLIAKTLVEMSFISSNAVIVLCCYLYCRNLLMPAGMTLAPANFILKAYSAEDLPRSMSFLYQSVQI